MFDISSTQPVSWLEFVDPDPKSKGENDEDLVLRVNMTFMASHWKCLYGCGCPGIFAKKDEFTAPDLGCCTKGFYVSDLDEQKRIDKLIPALIRSGVWDAELIAAYKQKKAWSATRRRFKNADDKQGIVKSRVVNGGCIFANRADGSVGSTGRVGCAWLHYGVQEQKSKAGDIADNSKEHINYMPGVCWQLPIYTYYGADDVYVITAWSADEWMDGDAADEDGGHSSWMNWWCVDSPDAYVNDKPIIYSMERELRKVMGDKAYEVVLTAYHKNYKSTALKMAAADPGNHTLLPMVVKPSSQTIAKKVGIRIPIREMPNGNA